MPATVNEEKLTAALSALELAHEWPPGLMHRLRERIISDSDEKLFQINPFTFAEEHGLEPDLGIQLFLHATRAGLMQIYWSLRCRGCGEIVSSRDGLAQLDHDFWCASCARSSPTTLDDHVEVSFTVAPEIRELRYHQPETLSLDDYFYRFRFSNNIVIRDIDKHLLTFLREQVLILEWLDSGAEQTFEIDLPAAGWVVGSPRAMITVAGEASSEPRELGLDYHDGAFHPRVELEPGPLRLTLRNSSEARVRVFLYFTPIVTYFDYLPHLTGHRVLNSSEFRRCLGTEVVRPGTGIPINDSTLLFTDMAGSTAMYDRVGDSAAFELVSKHFEAMARIITRCGGVVVKTMGDAIMASFNTPAEAVRAALRIIEDSDDLQLLPKVGIHRGPCIVVNQNDRVDYFGQTVNIAARAQGVAGGNELCITQAVWEEILTEEQLGAQLRRRFGEIEPELRKLKGVSDPVSIYRVLVRPT